MITLPRAHLTLVEIAIYVVLALVLAIGIAIAAIDEALYVNWFVPEDGVIEYATAGFLLLVSGMSIWRLVFNREDKSAWFAASMLFMAILFFFGAGEEISWGQRIFDFQSSEFFLENNGQGETNLHNLMVGDTKINKVIFGQFLTLALLLYFLVGPYFYARSEGLRRIIDGLFIPVPDWHHSLGFVLALIATALIASGKNAELSEFALSILLFLIVWHPRNANLFERI